jgi:hypothetical protein
MSFCTTTAPATVAKKAAKSCRPEGGTEEIGPGKGNDGRISIHTGSRGRIISTNFYHDPQECGLFALIGMILLTVVLALGFIRDISGFTAGAVAAMAMLISLIHLLASLSVTVFLYVFHKAQS